VLWKESKESKESNDMNGKRTCRVCAVQVLFFCLKKLLNNILQENQVTASRNNAMIVSSDKYKIKREGL